MKSSRALPPGMRSQKQRRSLDREIGGANDLLPLRRLGGEELAEVGRRAGDRNAAEVAELLEHARILERLVDLVVELVDNFLRRAVRDTEAEEGARLVAGDALGDGRHVSQFWSSLGSRHSKRAQLAGLDVADRGRQVIEGHLHLAGEE